MINTLVFITFYNLCYLFGKSLIIYFEKFTRSKILNTKIADIEISTLYNLFFLFFIGNVAFLVNFFIPTKYLLYLCVPLLIYNFKNTNFFNTEIKNLLLNTLICFVIGISSFGIGFSYDAGLYHLNNQAWISESKIVIGLVNIYYPYGWSSIYEYISSVLIFANNYIFIHFLNLSFIVLFFVFIFKNIERFSNKDNFLKLSSFAILIYGFLDNFGFEGGRNGFIQVQAIGKFDTSFGILLSIFSLLTIQKILKNEYQRLDLILFTFFSLFLIQIKLSGLVFLLLYSFYIFKYFKNNVMSIKIFVKDTAPATLLGMFWMLKNVLTSGCLIFYLEQSCINSLRWYEKGTSSYAVFDTKKFNLGYSFDLTFSEWSNLWISNQINKTFFQNFLISIILLLFVRVFFLKKKKNTSWKNFLFFNVYIYTSLLVWLYGAPDPRFGSGIFLLIVSSLFLDCEFRKFKFLNLNNQNIFRILFVICLILVPRVSSYKALVNSFHFDLIEVDLPNIEYIDNQIWGVKPKIDDRCWVNLQCSNIKTGQLNESSKFGYKIFTKDS